MWWFWESHGDRPKCRIIRVYSFREYFLDYGAHTFVEDYLFWRQLYRAIGMVFPWLKQIWDKAELKMWPPKNKFTGFPYGM